MHKRRKRHERKAPIQECEPSVSPVPIPGNKEGGSGSGNIFAIYQFIFPYSDHRSLFREPWLKNKLPGTSLLHFHTKKRAAKAAGKFKIYLKNERK